MNHPELARAFDTMSEAERTPRYPTTLDVDRDGQAEIDAIINRQHVPPPADDAAALGRALAVLMAYDAEVYARSPTSPRSSRCRRRFPGHASWTGLSVAQSEPPLLAPGPSRQKLMQLVS